MTNQRPTGRAIIVHSLDDARVALAIASETGRPVTLLSAPGAAGYAGAAWFREVVALAQADFPETDVTAVLDCGDRPGLVLAALRQGLSQVRFTGPKRTAAKLEAIARQGGARVLTGALRALDLNGLDDPEPACRAWLGATGGRP